MTATAHRLAGLIRLMPALLMLVLLLVGHAIARPLPARHTEPVGPNWTNSTTRKTVTLPVGWRYLGPLQDNYLFSNADRHLTVYFYKEPAGSDLSALGGWSRSLLAPDLWTSEGLTAGLWPATFYVALIDHAVWRLTYVDKAREAFAQPPDPDLITALLKSIGAVP